MEKLQVINGLQDSTVAAGEELGILAREGQIREDFMGGQNLKFSIFKAKNLIY